MTRQKSKILVFFSAFMVQCQANQVYRSQIRYLQDNHPNDQHGFEDQNQIEAVAEHQKFQEPVVVPQQVINLPMFRYRLLPNPYLYPSRDSLQPRSQYASYPTYTAYYNPSPVLGSCFTWKITLQKLPLKNKILLLDYSTEKMLE